MAAHLRGNAAWAKAYQQETCDRLPDRARALQPPHRVRIVEPKEYLVIVLGLILLIIGLVASISILTTIGVILLVVGLILNLVPVGGSRRRVW